MASRYALCALNGPTTTHTSLATHGTTLLNVCLRLNCPSISETSGSHTASSNCPGAMATKWGAHEMSKSNSVKQSCTSTHGNQHEGFSKVPGALKNSPSHATLRSVITCFFVFFDEGDDEGDDEEDDQNDLCARCSWSPSPPLSSSPVLSTSIAMIPSPSSFAAAAAGKFPDRNRIKTSTSLPSSFFFVSVLVSFISSSSPASSIAASGSSSPPAELKSISSPLSSSTRTIEAPAANLLLMREAALKPLPLLPLLPPPPVFIVIKLSSSTCFMSLILSTMESSKNALAAAFGVVVVVVVVKFVSSSSSTKIRLNRPFCPSISIESISTKSFSA